MTQNDGIWVFPKIVIPQNGWFIRENPMIWGGFPIIFGNTHMVILERLDPCLFVFPNAEIH